MKSRLAVVNSVQLDMVVEHFSDLESEQRLPTSHFSVNRNHNHLVRVLNEVEKLLLKLVHFRLTPFHLSAVSIQKKGI